MSTHVIPYDTADPGDTSDLESKLSAFAPRSIRRLSLLVKTEGNSDLNDHSREYGLLAAHILLKDYGGQQLLDRSSFLFSTGCEGAMTPFGLLFLDVEDDRPRTLDKALVFSVARSRSLRSEEIGTPAHSDIVAQTVIAAMKDANVEAADVQLVIVKTPILSHIPATDGSQTANKRLTSAFSKAVGALGAGVALGEVDRAHVVQEAFDTNLDLYARRAMVFSGSETDKVEILLLANRPGASGDLQLHVGFQRDLLDAEGIRATLRNAGIELGTNGEVTEPERVVASIIKAGINPDASLRGRRTKMKTSHIDMDLHIRATMSGIIGSILGHTRSFISANTIHQAPVGGGISAFVVRKE
jgi:cyanuric acid amidohydrolase